MDMSPHIFFSNFIGGKNTILYFILLVLIFSDHSVKSITLDPPQLKAAEQLIARIVGTKRSASFILGPLTMEKEKEIDTFELVASQPGSTSGTVVIHGNSGVALASGFHWYLKYSCNISIAYGKPALDISVLPDVWPQVVPILMTSPLQYRYYMNVVTHSYTAAFWDWSRWETEIDWMAMMGINLPLAFTGQEYIWDRVYRERFNLTRDDMNEHFAGPAFLAWGRMGNIRGWGSIYDSAKIKGLTTNWMEKQRDLQKAIVTRERSLGMRTVLVAFAGHVPRALHIRYPSANVTKSRGWCGFSDRYSYDSLLDASDPLFKEIGKAFLELQTEEYGTDHIYNGDTFNEMSPSSTAPEYLANWGAAVYDSLKIVDPDAVWFVQGWSLHGWKDDALQAYWSKIPIGKLLSLDLGCAESGGSWKKYTDQIKPGRGVICGLLDNMGGRRALTGNLHVIANQTLRNIADAPPNLIPGLGWNPEDLHANPIKWQLMGEVGWRNTGHEVRDIRGWVEQYALRRYYPHTLSNNLTTSYLKEAWTTLLDSTYGGGNIDRDINQSNDTKSKGYVSDGFSKDGMARIPSLSFRLYKSPNPKGILDAWRLLLLAGNSTPALAQVPSFQYDLIDVTRQALTNHFADVYSSLVASCPSNNNYTSNFTRHNRSTCAGRCLPPGESGNCDRMPGCGHDRIPPKPPCDPIAMEKRCMEANASVGVMCTAFNTNGYLYNGDGVTPFTAYPLQCYIRNSTGWGGPKCASAMLDATREGSQIIQIGLDLARALYTEKHFSRLGEWITSARAFGASNEEKDLLEWNARMQVTMWGSREANGATISDYASKPWAGLIKNYHIPLWRHFLQRMGKSAATPGADNPYTQVRLELYSMAEQWINSTSNFVPEPNDEDPFTVSNELYVKYGNTQIKST